MDYFLVLIKIGLKKSFDESIPGFHFYDLGFCVQNYLEGVKIGVISNIDITHLSMGQTQ